MWTHCVVSGVCQDKGVTPPFPSAWGGGGTPFLFLNHTYFPAAIVWYEVLDLFFSRVKHRQHYRVGKLQEQSPHGDFPQWQPHNCVMCAQRLKKGRGCWTVELLGTSPHHLFQVSQTYKSQQPNFRPSPTPRISSRGIIELSTSALALRLGQPPPA